MQKTLSMSHRFPLALVLSVLYNIAITVFRDYQFGIFQNLLRITLLFGLLFFAPLNFSKRSLIPFGILGGICSFFIVAMRTVITETGPRPWTISLIIPFIFFAVVYTLAFTGLSACLEFAPKFTDKNPVPSLKVWICFFLVLVVFWIPVFLVMGPLRVSADSAVVISQALGVNYLDDSHPILYTLIASLFLQFGQWLGNILIGAYLFGFAQLCAMAAVLSYSLYWMYRRGLPLFLCIASIAYFTLSPVFAINAITMWKDIPFNCMLLLFTLTIYSIAQTKGEWLLQKKNAAFFLIVSALVCFFRGNGFAIVAIVFAVLVLCFRGKAKRFVLLFLPFLIIVSLIRGPVYSALGITRLGSVEAAAIPMQQISRVVASGAEISDEDAAIIESVVPLSVIREEYISSSPDNIKRHPQFNGEAFSQNQTELLKLWLRWIPQHLGEYVNAWLLQTIGYWKYDFPPHAAHIENSPLDSYGVDNKDIVLKLTGVNLQGFLLSRTEFISMGLMALFALFTLCHLVATRRSLLSLCLLPMLLVWSGLMLGAPTYRDLRYMLVFALAIPVISFLLFAPKKPSI